MGCVSDLSSLYRYVNAWSRVPFWHDIYNYHSKWNSCTSYISFRNLRGKLDKVPGCFTTLNLYWLLQRIEPETVITVSDWTCFMFSQIAMAPIPNMMTIIKAQESVKKPICKTIGVFKHILYISSEDGGNDDNVRKL